MSSDDSLPPWAAEVVQAEAARFDARPWWRTKRFVAALALVGVGIAALFILLPRNNDLETADTDGPGRMMSGPSDSDVATAPSSSIVEEATGTEPDGADALPPAEPALTDEPQIAQPAASAQPPTSETGATDEQGTDSATTKTTEPVTEDSTSTTTATSTTSTSTTTSTTTTEAPVATVDGVSAACLQAMQAAADTPDASDVVEEVLHPTFEPCTTEAEWQLAATSTGALNIVDPNAWVLINECVYNADLYELPLCRSMVDPESGPRRIDCADGRREIEWTFVNDTRPNGLICAEFFQVICPDGLVHNVPLEAFSEEEAVDLLCT